jgi:hypothetical protein
MERFIRDLSTFASVYRSDLTTFHVKEESFDARFRQLQRTVKGSIQSVKRPKAVDPPAAVRSGQAPPANGRRSAPPALARAGGACAQLAPMPYPVRLYALPAQPSRAAGRIYRPRAREGIDGARLDLIDEFVNYPTPEGARLLDGRIDPALRVGDFSANELRWNGSVISQIV